jgi:hypothetical protein
VQQLGERAGLISEAVALSGRVSVDVPWLHRVPFYLVSRRGR